MNRRPIPPAVAEWLAEQEEPDELTLEPPSGDRVELDVSIRVSGPGLDEFRDRFVADPDRRDDLVFGIAELLSRLSGFVPIGETTVAVHFDD